MAKKIFIGLILVLLFLALIIFALRFLIGGSEDDWICQNGEWIKHGNPSAAMPTAGCGENKLDENKLNKNGLGENEPSGAKPKENGQKEENLKIKLYYYNLKRDKEIAEYIPCSPDAVLPVERKIAATKTLIQDAINLLIQGQLTKQERIAGFSTEFPLEGFKLLSADLQSETLILKFEDAFAKTIGGSCRATLLATQIEKTAKQFPEVKFIKFEPEDGLFQP